MTRDERLEEALAFADSLAGCTETQRHIKVLAARQRAVTETAHCINCGLNADPKCACSRGRAVPADSTLTSFQRSAIEFCTRKQSFYVNHRIVCAANRKRFTGEVVLGIRHWDALMRRAFEAAGGTEGDPTDQGFIDNKGNFLTRNQAWPVAVAANQIVRRVGGDDVDGGTLYSENLY